MILGRARVLREFTLPRSWAPSLNVKYRDKGIQDLKQPDICSYAQVSVYPNAAVKGIYRRGRYSLMSIDLEERSSPAVNSIPN